MFLAVLLMIEAAILFGFVVGMISGSIPAGIFTGLGVVAVLVFFGSIIDIAVRELVEKLCKKSYGVKKSRR